MTKLNLEHLFSFLDVPPKPLIGVDISGSSIKMVEISQKRSGELVFENYSIEPTPRDAFGEHGEPKPDELGAGIDRAWKKLRSSVKNVAIALPSNTVITKKIKLSNELDEDALEQEVFSEAQQHIPFQLDEASIDWSVLGPHPSSPETDNEVLICATRKDRLLDYMAAIEAAGLVPLVVDIESHAQQAAFLNMLQGQPELEDQVVAVADAGSSLLTLSVYNRGSLIFSKEIPFGANQLTETLVHLYGITPEQAEQAKRADGGELSDYHNQALNPFLESLGMEINRALQFFLTQATVERIDRLFIAGGCGVFSNAAPIVSAATQIDTFIANPFQHLEMAHKNRGEALAKDAPLLMTACGLALRRFD